MKGKKINLCLTSMQTRMIEDYIEYIKYTNIQACPCKSSILFNILFKEFKQDKGFNKYVENIRRKEKEDLTYLTFKFIIGTLHK